MAARRRYRKTAHDPRQWFPLVGMILNATVAIVRAIMDSHGQR